MKMRSLMTVVLVLLVAITPQAQVELYFVNSSVVQHPDKAAMERLSPNLSGRILILR